MLLWRGSLLPLGCEATPKSATAGFRYTAYTGFATAAQPSGTVRRSDKLPRHNKCSHHRLSSALRIKVIQHPVDGQLTEHDHRLNPQHHVAMGHVHQPGELTEHPAG